MDASPIIRTTPELDDACARARTAGMVARDTESVWTRTYRDDEVRKWFFSQRKKPLAPTGKAHGAR